MQHPYRVECLRRAARRIGPTTLVGLSAFLAFGGVRWFLDPRSVLPLLLFADPYCFFAFLWLARVGRYLQTSKPAAFEPPLVIFGVIGGFAYYHALVATNADWRSFLVPLPWFLVATLSGTGVFPRGAAALLVTVLASLAVWGPDGAAGALAVALGLIILTAPFVLYYGYLSRKKAPVGASSLVWPSAALLLLSFVELLASEPLSVVAAFGRANWLVH